MRSAEVKRRSGVDGTAAKRSFKRGRLSEQVVTEMERMIQEEYREPGLRLPKEAELAERFRVSRIVIREAMKVLEDRGMVEIRAGRGTMTAAPTPQQVKASLLRLFRDQPSRVNVRALVRRGRASCALSWYIYRAWTSNVSW